MNERTNHILRKFIPKGRSIRDYTDEQILMFAGEINATPRKRLGCYQTPEELFDDQLDRIYVTTPWDTLFQWSIQFVIAIYVGIILQTKYSI